MEDTLRNTRQGISVTTHNKFYATFQEMINLLYDDDDMVFYLYGYSIFKEFDMTSKGIATMRITHSQLKDGLGVLTSHDSELMEFYLHSLPTPLKGHYQVD